MHVQQSVRDLYIETLYKVYMISFIKMGSIDPKTMLKIKVQGGRVWDKET